MVMPRRNNRERATLITELLVAMALLTGALLPLAYSVRSEKRLAKASYQHAVAMEIVDGEMEVLVAGEWRAYPAGSHDYQVRAGALTNLPPGRFVLTIQPSTVRLEWRPEAKDNGGAIVREAVLK